MQTHLNLSLADEEDGPIRAPKFQYQADTMQVPCGEHSILWALEEGAVTAAAALLYLMLNHGSSWNTGMTWNFSSRGTSKKIGLMSVRYVRSILKCLTEKGWIKPIIDGNAPRSYRLRHHLCDPEDVPIDRDGKPLKFAVPRGNGGPFESLYAGDISWKACLVWIVQKFYSDWETGETYPCTMLELARRCRFRPATAVQCIKNLTAADMMYRLSEPHEKSIFQLYPQPFPMDSKKKSERPQSKFRKEHDITTDGEYWYSDNGKYRRSRETLEYEHRSTPFKGVWKPVRDANLHRIPTAITQDFDRALEAKMAISAAFGGVDDPPS